MSNLFLFLSLMVPGTMFLGLSDAYTRKLLKTGIHESLLLGLTYTASGLLMFAALFIFGFPEIQSGFFPAFIGTVALNSVSQVFWYKAFKYEEASLIAPLRLLTPPLVLLTGFFTLRETPSLGGAIGVLTTVVGLWFLMRAEAAHTRSEWHAILHRPGVRFGLLGALLFAFSFPLDKQSVTHSSGLFFAFAGYFSIGVITLIQTHIFHAQKGNLYASARPALKEMPWYILMHAVGGFLTLQALSYTLAVYAASVKRLWSLWAVLFSGAFLREKNIFQKLLATFVMVAGVALTAISIR